MAEFEHEFPVSGFHNEEDQSIFDIPGVEGSDLPEDLGALREDVDEESDENVLEDISHQIRNQLKGYGVEGMGHISKDEIIQLWYRMEMSQHLVADLILHSLIDIRDKSQNELAKVNFNDLKQRSEVLVNPYDVRRDVIEKVAPNLMKLGYGRLDAYRWPRSQKEDLALAFRVEGWLVGLYFMQDLPERVRHEVVISKDQKIDRTRLFKLTMDQIILFGQEVVSPEFKARFDTRLNSDVKAYQDIKKSVRNAYKIAQSAFTPVMQ